MLLYCCILKSDQVTENYLLLIILQMRDHVLNRAAIVNLQTTNHQIIQLKNYFGKCFDLK